jgi:hypothetical protein
LYPRITSPSKLSERLLHSVNEFFPAQIRLDPQGFFFLTFGVNKNNGWDTFDLITLLKGFLIGLSPGQVDPNGDKMLAQIDYLRIPKNILIHGHTRAAPVRIEIQDEGLSSPEIL